MKLTPKTDAELAEEGLLPEGVYDFEVRSAENKISKAGNEMIKLSLNVFAEDGSARMVFDYLLDSFPRKLKNASVACGLLSKYEQGEILALDFEGRAGKVRIGRREDKTGQFPTQNTVIDYIAADSWAPSARKNTPADPWAPSTREKTPAGELDDEIPF